MLQESNNNFNSKIIPQVVKEQDQQDLNKKPKLNYNNINSNHTRIN